MARNSVYWALCVECHRLWHQLTLFLARVVAKQVLFVSFIENILIVLEYIYWMESWMTPFVKTLSILMRWLTADHILLLQRVLSTHFRLVVISVMSFRSNLAQKCNAQWCLYVRHLCASSLGHAAALDWMNKVWQGQWHMCDFNYVVCLLSIDFNSKFWRFLCVFIVLSS